MRIGIFGGTFNPPHRGHLLAAQAAIESLKLDRLYVIPAGYPPHKPLPPDTPEAEARYRMAQLLFAGEEKVRVSNLEVEAPGPSYTIDTVLEMKTRHPEASLFLLMGTDMFLSLEQWYMAEELLRAATPAVFTRGEGQQGAIFNQIERVLDRYDVEPLFVKHQPLEISSTVLRDMLPKRQGVAYVGDTLYGEILRRGHYGARANFPWLREQVYARIKPKRVAHVQGTEEEALRLAKFWGADETLAREAAILHDLTKGKSLEEQLRLCEKYDMIPDTIERENGKLLHAKTGALLARDKFGICDAVFAAIACHTTGRPDMSLLEKILYLADFVEPNRSFEGLLELKILAYTNLDQAMARGLAHTMEDLERRNKVSHPRTEEALAWYRDRKQTGR